MNIEEQMYKMCTKCFDDKPFKMFYNCLRNYDGKTSWCKQFVSKSKRHYIQRRKLDYSHKFKKIRITLMNCFLNNDSNGKLYHDGVKN